MCTGVGEHALHRGRHDWRGYQPPRPSGVPRHRGLPRRDKGAGTTGGKRAADGQVSRQTVRENVQPPCVGLLRTTLVTQSKQPGVLTYGVPEVRWKEISLCARTHRDKYYRVTRYQQIRLCTYIYEQFLLRINVQKVVTFRFIVITDAHTKMLTCCC